MSSFSVGSLLNPQNPGSTLQRLRHETQGRKRKGEPEYWRRERSFSELGKNELRTARRVA